MLPFRLWWPRRGVWGGGYYPPPYPPPEGILDPEDILVIDPHQITAVEMICEPLEVSGKSALLQCGADGAGWVAQATFVESGDTVTLSADYVSGDLHLLTRDSWPPETYGKCVIDQKG